MFEPFMLQAAKQMLFLFDPMGLLTIIIGCFMAGFLPMLIIVMRSPEARAFIKAQIAGGIIICSTDDAGVEFVLAKPFGANGQYISGKNKLGQRRIFVHPKLDTVFAKSFILKGIRRPIFFHGGRTVIVNPNVLKAITVADANKKDIPNPIKNWASGNGVHLPLESPDGDAGPFDDEPALKEAIKKVGNDIYVLLFTMNPRRLQWYFRRHYDEGQYDVLLEQSKQEGYEEGRPGGSKPGGGGRKMLLIGIVVFVLIAIVGIVLLGSGVKL